MTSRQLTLAPFVVARKYQDVRPRGVARKCVALFDRHGLSLRPWHQRGFECVAFNPKASTVATPGVTMRTAAMSTVDEIRECLPPANEIEFLIASPPCRDLCAAGARWWKRKKEANPHFQEEAVEFLKRFYALLCSLQDVPFVMLLPASPRIRTLFRIPDFTFSPHEFGGYLASNTPHPLFPDTVPTQDRYTKATFAFTGGHSAKPWKRPLPPIFTTVHLKSGITKRISPVLASRRNLEARSVTPLGFAVALAEAHTL